MNEKEKLASYIANCKCCLLAQSMKTCPICRFNIGLAEQVQWLAPKIAMDAQPIPVEFQPQTQTLIFAVS